MFHQTLHSPIYKGRQPGRNNYPIPWNKWRRRAMLWFSAGCILLFFLFPFYWQVINALKTPAELNSLPITWFPHQLYLGHLVGVLHYTELRQFVLNSLIVTGSTTLLCLIFGSGAAYSLARLPLPAKQTILFLLILGVGLPAVSLVISLFIFLRAVHLLDTYPALILPDTAVSLPLAIWILANFFRQIPGHLTEQAEVDGCTPLQALRAIILPLAMPGLIATTLLVFINTWNEFLFALTFTFSPGMMTVPLAIVRMGDGVSGESAAASLIVTVPIIVVALIFQTRIVEGLTAATSKG